MKHRAVGALFIAVTLSACSSSYRPANSPRVAVVMDGGYPAFYRDGKEYGGGLFMGGVEDAVKGNPRAEDEARTAHNLMVGGFVLELAGLGSELAGLALLPGAAESGSSGRDAAVGGLVIGGLGAVLAGSILILNAPPHMYDAINIYNDGITEWQAPLLAPMRGGYPLVPPNLAPAPANAMPRPPSATPAPPSVAPPAPSAAPPPPGAAPPTVGP